MENAERILIVAQIPPELRRRLGARFHLVDQPIESERPFPDAEAIRIAATTSVAGASEALMEGLPNLRLILCNGSGLERIDLAAAARRNVIVRNTPDVVTEDTADFAIALTYAVARRIAEADRFVRAGRWTKERLTPSRRVYGKTMGIVGLGKIGSAIARRAAGIGMKVLYTGPRPKPEIDLPYVADLADLARRSDVLVLCCPGDESTRNLIGADVLRELGLDGILVNVSRGTVVNEAALLDALSRRSIAGAGLDVFVSEPDVNPMFFALDNVVLQPHYAAVTIETREAMADILEDAVDSFLAGRLAPDAALASRSRS